MGQENDKDRLSKMSEDEAEEAYQQRKAALRASLKEARIATPKVRRHTSGSAQNTSRVPRKADSHTCITTLQHPNDFRAPVSRSDTQRETAASPCAQATLRTESTTCSATQRREGPPPPSQPNLEPINLKVVLDHSNATLQSSAKKRMAEILRNATQINQSLQRWQQSKARETKDARIVAKAKTICAPDATNTTAEDAILEELQTLNSALEEQKAKRQKSYSAAKVTANNSVTATARTTRPQDAPMPIPMPKLSVRELKDITMKRAQHGMKDLLNRSQPFISGNIYERGRSWNDAKYIPVLIRIGVRRESS